MMGIFVIIGFGLVGFVAWAIASRSAQAPARRYPSADMVGERV